MSTLTVGPGQQYASIASAVQAAASGDTIDVSAGTYNDDFLSIEQSLTLQAVGGEVKMTEDTSPPDGKAMITEGQPGISVAINGFDISGVTVGDGNGAAIRYEGGNLSLSNDYFHDNQEGLLGAPDPNGSITIDNSEFASNGDGSGSTHNIYVGAINSFSITDSYVHDANVGHEIKSRAANNTITGNRIFDNSASASYSIDLPNGGNANIGNNTIEQGPNTQIRSSSPMARRANPTPAPTCRSPAIPSSMTTLRGASILNPTGTSTSFTDNSVYGLTGSQLSTGPLDKSGTVFLASRPSLDTSSLTFINPPGGGDGGTTGDGGTGGGTGGDGGSGAGDPPPPPPPPPLTLDQYHAMVLNDFATYLIVHPDLFTADPNTVRDAFSALVTEIYSTTVLTAPVPGDLWS